MTSSPDSSVFAPASDALPDAVLDRLAAERHSCRAFLQTPLPRATIERMLAIAQRAPSWCNTQPWHVHLVSGAALDRFREAYVPIARGGGGAPDFDFPLAYRGPYQARRKECGLALYASLGIGREDRTAAAEQALENFRFFGAPHLAVISTERDLGDYGAIDCGGYLGLLLLAAQSLGIAAVPQAAIATHSGFVREFIGLPESRQVVAGVAFGWRDDAHPINGFRTRRATQEEAVTWIDAPG
ncbi:MAG: nitroreductase [Pseudomonadota bacterium]